MTGITSNITPPSPHTVHSFKEMETPQNNTINNTINNIKTTIFVNDYDIHSQSIPPAIKDKVTVVIVHTFQHDIQNKKNLNREQIKNITDLKTKKIACQFFVGVLTALAIAGVLTACVFCPPLSFAIFFGGAAVISLGTFGALNGVKALYELPEKDKKNLEETCTTLDEALDLFQKYPATSENSFEKFLQTQCEAPYDKKLQGRSYILKDLPSYISRFKEKLKSPS